MCTSTALVPIPSFLLADYQYIFDSGECGSQREFDIDMEGRQCFALDACIVPAVVGLWMMGIRTTGCCCGHGSGHGVISVEVPNGGDVVRRDNQTGYFYEQISKNQNLPLHKFHGSQWNEGKDMTVVHYSDSDAVRLLLSSWASDALKAIGVNIVALAERVNLPNKIIVLGAGRYPGDWSVSYGNCRDRADFTLPVEGDDGHALMAVIEEALRRGQPDPENERYEAAIERSELDEHWAEMEVTQQNAEQFDAEIAAANAPLVAVDLSHEPLEPCVDCGVDTATYHHLPDCPRNQGDEEIAGHGTVERFA